MNVEARAALERACWPADRSEPVLESTVGSALRAAAAVAPDRTALLAWGAVPGERRSWTFAALLRDAERTAQALLTRFQPGEHVAVYSGNCPEWLLLEFGAALAGLVLVTVNPASRARELDYLLRQSRAAGVFHGGGYRGNPLESWVGEVRTALPALRVVAAFADWAAFIAAAAPATAAPGPLPEVLPQAIAQIQYTSGTTGRPKGALLHHRGLTNTARFFVERAELGEGDVLVHALPFFHTTGCGMAALGPLQRLATQVFLPAFDAGQLLAAAEQARATHLIGVPTMIMALLEHPEFAQRDLGSLRVVMAGGASVAPELVRAIESRLHARFNIGYGQTEASPIVTQVRLDDSPEVKADTVGRPLPQTEVKIVDPASGATVACNAVGEMCVRGFQVMRGYYDMPEATAAAIDAEGWLHTGDLASMDAQGYCRIVGRLKDMVIRGGENLYPAEIEAVLVEHPAVADAAVIGVSDPLMGEELAAFVRPRGARPPAAELRAHVRARLAAPKAPRYWVFVESLPLNASGKVQKFVLHERWQGGTLSVVDAAARS
ncbi:MAG: AMP-binding protein [Gammaproteobacteria bacterium]|nr:AMP-binding protein [Gammaproteobacteria bacterium]